MALFFCFCFLTDSQKNIKGNCFLHIFLRFLQTNKKDIAVIPYGKHTEYELLAMLAPNKHLQIDISGFLLLLSRHLSHSHTQMPQVLYSLPSDETLTRRTNQIPALIHFSISYFLEENQHICSTSQCSACLCDNMNFAINFHRRYFLVRRQLR